MSFGESIKTVFQKYAEFSGRATRPEFWWWVLFTFLVSAALGAIQLPVLTIDGGGQLAFTTTTLSGLWGLATLLPSLAVTVRRLRDAGLEWVNLFWLLLPVAGVIILIVQCAKPTQVAPAVYAPPPGYGPPQGYAPPPTTAPAPGYAHPSAAGPAPGYAPPAPATTAPPPPGATPPTAGS